MLFALKHKSDTHILFTPSNYPSKVRPTASTFVQEFVRATARSGANCTVLAPIRLAETLRSASMEKIVSFDDSIPGNHIRLIRPWFMSFSKKRVLGVNTGRWSYLGFRRACLSSLRLLHQKPDLVFGHFLYAGGATAAYIGCKLNIPSFVRVGESGTWSVDSVGLDQARKDLKGISGFVANSKAIAEKLFTVFGMEKDKILVETNGVDCRQFFPREKKQVRQKLGLPRNLLIIAFVGHFDKNKGPDRLIAALEGIEDVGLIFIGSGQIPVKDPRILFKGRVAHEEIPEYLSAADMFVLPTLAEGSCNAVIEALACGLPVVSSDREFNHSALDGTCSILVDPTDIRQIREAVLKLKDDGDFRQRLSQGALERAKTLDIATSASRVLKWLESTCHRFHSSSNTSED